MLTAAVSEKEVETMRQQIRSMQAMVESGRAAANVLEQKLAIAEVSHPLAVWLSRDLMCASSRIPVAATSWS